MRRHRKNRKTYVFLDNLSFHHSRVVLERARKNKQEFIFNAAYSSVYNPIERLWAIAKRQFARDLITEANYKDKEQIKALVMKSILHASESTLTKHVFACLRLM
jgi:transposase